MINTCLLFDLDGVLLESKGYHKSLQTSIKRIGKILGAPNTHLTADQISRFETLFVTNEWDSLAICTALILVHLWQFDRSIRLDRLIPKAAPVTLTRPDFGAFLRMYIPNGDLPGETAYEIILRTNPWLDSDLKQHLSDILQYCRDIYRSPILPLYQETVLGSEVFQKTYGLVPQLGIESYLKTYDRPIIHENQLKSLHDFLSNTQHAAGILTNRPNMPPGNYLSSPEAELGIELVQLSHLPFIGSGTLAWYAQVKRRLPNYTFLKPNPVHALSLLQLILGRSVENALENAVNLWLGKGKGDDWQAFHRCELIIFEDSTKGLISAQTAQDLLQTVGIDIKLTKIGVSTDRIKRKALESTADRIIETINDLQWEFL